eukprot:Opistho-1_new@70792
MREKRGRVFARRSCSAASSFSFCKRLYSATLRSISSRFSARRFSSSTSRMASSASRPVCGAPFFFPFDAALASADDVLSDFAFSVFSVPFALSALAATSTCSSAAGLPSPSVFFFAETLAAASALSLAPDTAFALSATAGDGAPSFPFDGFLALWGGGAFTSLATPPLSAADSVAVRAVFPRASPLPFAPLRLLSPALLLSPAVPFAAFSPPDLPFGVLSPSDLPVADLISALPFVEFPPSGLPAPELPFAALSPRPRLPGDASAGATGPFFESGAAPTRGAVPFEAATSSFFLRADPSRLTGATSATSFDPALRGARDAASRDDDGSTGAMSSPSGTPSWPLPAPSASIPLAFCAFFFSF